MPGPIGNQNNRAPKYTPEEDTRIRELWDAGFKALAIAGMMPGRTRFSVIGRANRLGLPARTKPARAKRNGRTKKSLMQKPAVPLPVAKTADVLDLTQPFVQPQVRECCYILGDPKKAYRYCLDDTEPGRSFCSAHAARVYVRVAA
jgi:hypothetical protein